MKKKFIVVTFKSSLRKLFIGEHYFFYSQGIILPTSAIINDLPALIPMFNTLRIIFDKEDDLYKLSQAAFQTPEIRQQNDLRVVYFNFLWDCVDIIRIDNNPAFAQALAKLDYLHHNYAHLPGENYYDMSGTLLNFLQDCLSADYQSAIQLLSTHPMCNISGIINGVQTANNTFMTLYQERSMTKEQIAELGKLSEIRFDVDDVFDSFVDTINVNWTSNEMDAKDPNIRSKLLELKGIISAAIHQAQLNLAHRGAYKIKDDNKTDDGSQTPDATLPAAPDVPNQNPSGGPHPLDPNEHPSMGEH